MKKLFIVGLIALVASAGYAAQNNVVTYRDVTLTAVDGGSLTNSATFTAGKGKTVFPVAVYQDITTQTNTCVLSSVPTGGSTAVTLETLTAVEGTAALETVGVGDVTADVDPIILTSGETLTLTGTGADSTNVTYVLRVKEVSN